MAWYFRKSVSVGPVRFNFSKSGIGASAGVKGFRVGFRPNGRSYIHAGRHGFYIREELGNHAPKEETQQQTQPVDADHPDTIHYNSASSEDLAPSSKNALVERLNLSYQQPRVDYLGAGLFFSLAIFSLFFSSSLSLLFLALGCCTFVIAAILESKRRTVKIEYNFEDANASIYKELISSFNILANNKKVWTIISSRGVNNVHESKQNAGASSLINRSDSQLGEGKPPWVETNIQVPVLKAREQTLYMMPDGILVYDATSVAFVDYKTLSISTDTTLFIEESPPSDAKIVDHTWKHPNKSGGPDRRFKDNYEIPVCQYGELTLESTTGMFIFLMTSQHKAAKQFKAGVTKIIDQQIPKLN